MRWWTGQRWLLRRYVLVQLYLAWHVVAAVMFAGLLILAPERLVDGPSLATLYGAMPPPFWGALFLLLAGLCALGVAHPLALWRFAVLALGLAQFAWALGLALPVIQNASDPDYRGNLLAPGAWLIIAVTTAIVGAETVREERRGAHGRG